jgi:murein DD-endopeptidase MepM/ murein hydrolase activator NlpD
MARAGFASGSLAALFLVSFAGGSAFSQDASTGAPVAHDKFRWPIRGPIIQPFKSGGNDGIDIMAAVGEWVHAAADGV